MFKIFCFVNKSNLITLPYLQVFINHDLKCFLGFVISSVLAKKQSFKEFYKSEYLDISDTDKDVIQYLAGSLVCWLKKKTDSSKAER